MRLDDRQHAAIFAFSKNVRSTKLHRFCVLFCFCISLVLTGLLQPGIVRAESPVSVFIPIAPKLSSGCSLTADEKMVEAELAGGPDQKRTAFVCNPTLTQIARERAQDMADRDYVDHVTPDGYGPNYIVEQGGYDLPDYYGSSLTSNNVESIAAGHETAVAVWSSWMDSESHRMHLLGETDFYAEQVDYGIGHVYVASGSTYRHYWVVLTAKPGE